ncbi:MAG: condensation domain-containing protein [Bdellovibrionales bacterium]
MAIYLNIISNKEWSNGLKELPLEYRDYAIWQHDWSLSSEFKSSLEFWEEKFFDRPLTLSFFNSSNKKGLNPRDSLTTKTSVGPLITRRLRRIAKQNKTSMFNLLITIYGLFLSRHVNEQKISIGTPITGRTNEKLEGLIGFFVDILVYPLEIDEEETFSKALNSTKNISQQILQNSKVPFDQIVKHLAPDRDELGQPLFQKLSQISTGQ